MHRCQKCKQPLREPPPAFCPLCGTPSASASPQTSEPRSGNSVALLRPAATAEVVPWEAPELHGGNFSALLATIQLVYTDPRGLFGRPATGGLVRPLIFSVLTGWVGQIAGLAAILMLGQVLASIDTTSQRLGPSELLVVLLFWSIVLAVQALLIPFVEAGLTQLALHFVARENAGFQATFRVSAYGRATLLCMIVPVLGTLVAAIWLIVVRILGLSEAHGISGGRAAAAVLLPPVLMTVVCCGIYLLVAMLFGLAVLGAIANH